MGTTVKYNGVTLLNCQTMDFREVVTYDDSMTDPLYRTITFRVMGYVHGHDIVATAGPFSRIGVQPHSIRGGASATYEGIRGILNQPRHRLQYICGDNQPDSTPGHLLDVTPGDDLNNGPKPLSVDVSHIVANNTFRIEWSCEVRINPCATGRNVLSNRWSSVDSIDANNFTVRTFNGTLKLANNQNGIGVADQNPHDFRGIVIPPLQDGMKRESMRFSASPDQKTLDWNIVDREMFYAPPKPATQMNIRHRNTSGEHGVTLTTSVEVSLEGDRNADQKELQRLCAAIIDQKIFDGAQGNAQKFVKLISYDVISTQGSQSANQVSVAARFMIPPDKNANNLRAAAALAQRSMGKNLTAQFLQGYEPDKGPGARRGESLTYEGAIPLVGAFVAALQDVCQTDESKAKFDEAIAAAQTSFAGGNHSPVQVQVRANNETTVTPDRRFNIEHTSKGVYTAYKVTTEIEEDETTIPLPVAGYTGMSPYDNSSYYDHDRGVYVGPSLNSQPPLSDTVRLAPRQTRKVVRVEAERNGEWPEMIEPQGVMQNAIEGVQMFLQKKRVWLNDPTPNPDGTEWTFSSGAEFIMHSHTTLANDWLAPGGAYIDPLTEISRKLATKRNVLLKPANLLKFPAWW